MNQPPHDEHEHCLSTQGSYHRINFNMLTSCLLISHILLNIATLSAMPLRLQIY